MSARPNSLKARDIAYSLHPFTNLVEHKKQGPMIITHGKGICVYDEGGTEYIDSGAGLWSVSLGYGEKRLAAAAARQMEKLPYYHLFRNMSHDVSIDLAEKLIGMLPVKMSKVFFNSSGSEANDTVVKMVWYYNNALGRPRKKKIIAQMKGYHGVTVAAASLCGLPRNHLDFDLPIANIRHSDCPHHYRYGKPGESEEDFATRLAENLDALIQREGPDTVAAFIAEPVQGAGGCIVPPRTYFEKVQAVLRKYDMLFIADEVICGFGRTGSMFGTETFDLKPDIITMAKALSSSYQPISAVAISEKIYDVFVNQSEKIGVFAHGYTYSAHPVCAAVALETLKIYEERDIVGHVRSVMRRFQDGVRRFADHPLVGEVRGVGLMAGLELVKNKKTKEPFDPKQGVGQTFMTHALQHGFIVRSIVDTVALSPPLIITAAEIDDLLARLEKTFKDTEASVAKQAQAA
ncbi:MAG: aspartate aminotransferase family protein [Proteobacteria bacterium]|nr:aspartate aminotransferase family protein [Pseudomonadota bacterium]